MSIEQRLSKAERVLGKRGDCTCANSIRTYFAPAIFPWQSEDCPPAVCDVCGGEVTILQIVYVEDWRGAWVRLKTD